MKTTNEQGHWNKYNFKYNFSGTNIDFHQTTKMF